MNLLFVLRKIRFFKRGKVSKKATVYTQGLKTTGAEQNRTEAVVKPIEGDIDLFFLVDRWQ